MKITSKKCEDCGNDAGFYRTLHKATLCINCHRKRMKPKRPVENRLLNILTNTTTKRRKKIDAMRFNIAKAAKVTLNDEELAYLEAKT